MESCEEGFHAHLARLALTCSAVKVFSPPPLRISENRDSCREGSGGQAMAIASATSIVAEVVVHRCIGQSA